MTDRLRRVLLAAELVIIFFGLPTLFWLGILPLRVLTTLWTFAVVGLVLLARDTTFTSRGLFRVWSLGAPARQILLRFFVCAGLLTLTCWWIDPPWFLGLVRERPGLWALIMLLYPILSVVPQGIIYRIFFIHRYRELVPAGAPMVAVSALAFAYSHIVFDNPVAVGLTAIGGLLFAQTYDSTRSGALASIEHALYGCLVITLGMGHFLFYRGG